MARKRRHRALLEVMGSSRGVNQRTNFEPKTRSPRKWWWWPRGDSRKDPTVAGIVAYDPNDPTTSATARSMNPSSFGIDPSASQEAHAVPAAPARDNAHPAFTLRVDRWTVIAGAAVVVAVVGVAFLYGRQSHQPPMLTAVTTEDIIRPAPANPNATPSVLDIRPAAAPQRPATPANVPTMTSPAKPAAPAAVPVIPPPADGRRTIGLNYVIVQSYPDEKSALEAQSALAKSGIKSTVEKGLPGWAAASWYSVVGTVGFDKIRASAEFDKYVRSIEAVGQQFAGTSKFKRFEPRAYKWKVAQ